MCNTVTVGWIQITDDVSAVIVAQLLYLEGESSTQNINMYISSRRFAIPSFFPFLVSIQISSKLNKFLELLEEMNSHMTSKGA